MHQPQSPQLAQLVHAVQERFPFCIPSIQDSLSSNPTAFERVGNLCLAAAFNCFPEASIEDLAESYVSFTIEQNRLQRSYDRTGLYPCHNQDAANSAVYQSDESMARYMAAMLLTWFLWPHHLAIFDFYQNRFVKTVAGPGKRILEIAPGHGLFGRVLLTACPDSHLDGVDISPLAVRISQRQMSIAPSPGSSRFVVGDAVNWPGEADYDLLVASGLLEHLDNPSSLVESTHRLLKPGGRAYLAAAITAAQMDHVTEFKSPEEVIDLFHAAGLVVHDHFVAHPAVVRQGSTRIPRVIALVVGRD